MVMSIIYRTAGQAAHLLYNLQLSTIHIYYIFDLLMSDVKLSNHVAYFIRNASRGRQTFLENNMSVRCTIVAYAVHTGTSYSLCAYGSVQFAPSHLGRQIV
jgi:hypothetical protein